MTVPQLPRARPHLAFFFNDPPTTEIYTLSLHDALPIPSASRATCASPWPPGGRGCSSSQDRKSTRLNSSHVSSSYAVFCLKKKKHATRMVDGAYARWRVCSGQRQRRGWLARPCPSLTPA